MKIRLSIPDKNMENRQTRYEFVEKTYKIPKDIQAKHDKKCEIILYLVLPIAVSILVAILTTILVNFIL